MCLCGSCVVVLGAAPATARTLKGVSNFALRPFSRAATKHRKRNEKQHRKQPQQARKNARKNNHNKPSTWSFLEPKWLPKSTPEASGGLSEAAGAPKKQTKARQRKLTGPKKAPRAPGSKKEGARGGTSTPGTPGGGWAGAPGRGRGGVLQQRKSAGSNAEKPSEAGSADFYI